MKKIIKKNKKAEGGESSTSIGTIIAIILLLAVIILVAFGLYNYGLPKWLNDFIPDYFRMNHSDDLRPQCPPGSTEKGFLDNKKYINFNNLKTNLYISNGDIYIDDESSLSSDFKIGRVDLDKNDLIFNSGSGIGTFINAEMDPLKPTYLQFLPKVADRILLANSFLYGNTICTKNQIVEDINQQDSCKLTCELIEGICSPKSVVDKIPNGKLDCPENQLCYIDKSLSRLSSESLSLNDALMDIGFHYDDIFDKHMNTLYQLLKKDSLIFSPGTRLLLRVDYSHRVPICYYLDNDFVYMKENNQGYNEVNKNKKNPNIPYYDNTFVYYNYMTSKEKMIQFVVFTPDHKEKVIKRWEVNVKTPQDSGFEKGTVISNSEFKSKIEKAPVMITDVNEKDSRLYVFATSQKNWENGFYFKDHISTFSYQIEKISETRVKIWAYYEKKISNGLNGYKYENEWHELKCGGGFYRTIAITDLSDSLSDTLDSCSW